MAVKKERIGKFLDIIGRNGVVIVLVIILVVIGIIEPTFLQPRNYFEVIKQSVILALLAIGLTFTMAGEGIDMGIDLSIGAEVSFIAVLFSSLIIAGSTNFIAFIICLAAGVVIGCINGFVAVNLKVVPFIATLGTMYILRGSELLISKGNPLQPSNVTRDYLAIYYEKFGFIPYPISICILVACICFIALYHTRLGMELFATGFNMKASMTSGINVKMRRFMAFIICSLLCAVAGIIFASKMSGAPVHGAEKLLMDAIAAAFIGTVLTSDRRPSLIGSVVGAILLESISSGFLYIGISYNYISMFKGFVMILVVASVLFINKDRYTAM
ncbi:ABC transporter permease [Petroclostridium sp. X23]|uniref:ABC transporter permease n=1 Tax=Petroclostridium sp. X23 TaxID=3045146 RepID=UPI0024AD5014|nr:ABC transporter permease [Petroclostridium sp. X23]WHH61641.1 ABC transporter permease [Petroclostridium sp. X23]